MATTQPRAAVISHLSMAALSLAIATPVNAFGAYISGVQFVGETLTFNDGSSQTVLIFDPGPSGGYEIVGFTDAGKLISSIRLDTRNPSNTLGDFVGVEMSGTSTRRRYRLLSSDAAPRRCLRLLWSCLVPGSCSDGTDAHPSGGSPRFALYNKKGQTSKTPISPAPPGLAGPPTKTRRQVISGDERRKRGAVYQSSRLRLSHCLGSGLTHPDALSARCVAR